MAVADLGRDMSLTLTDILVASAAVGTLAALARRHLALHRELRALESHRASLEQDLASSRQQAAQAEADQLFLARFVRELPHVAQELHSGSEGRAVPRLLLRATLRMLEPRKALVALRRRPAESDPERHLRMAVAAAFPDGGVEIGSEIPIGRGEIGYAAEVQRVMDRRDFDNQPRPTRDRLREEAAEGLQPDIVAPMVFGDELVGVIAVEGLRRSVTEAKDALRLLAHVGAVSMHTQAKYTEMKATASVDGLTGVYNKRYLTYRLAEELRRAADAVSCVSVFIFDVDHFKHYNDRNGHLAGDRILQKLARLVRDNVRQNTVFGRYGGEEFLVIFPGARRAQAIAAAENVRQVIAAHDFPFGFDQPLGLVSVSGGVAEYPDDGTDAASLVRAADEALYEAKRAGRNRVLAHQPRYLGGEEPQAPVPTDEPADRRKRAGLEPTPGFDVGGDAVALAATGAPSDGTQNAADFTPKPGTLMALASITPAGGVPRLTAQPSPEVLAAAVAAAPPKDPSARGRRAPYDHDLAMADGDAPPKARAGSARGEHSDET